MYSKKNVPQSDTPTPKQNPPSKNVDALVSKWFHSFEIDERGQNVVKWQGQIIAKVKDRYVIQLYSWIMGESTNQKIVTLKDMDGWELYNTDQEMRDKWETYWSHRQ